jgi:hypothetical protein
MKIEQERVFAGSLNLLPPSDKISSSDAIDFRNWRVDQAGVLRGGDTLSVVCNVGYPVHTIVKLTDYSVTQPGISGLQQVTFGALGAWLLGAGTQLFFYWPNGGLLAGPTALASGFSGNPLSITLWNGFIWVFDSLQQIKLNPLLLLTAAGEGTWPGWAVTSWLPAVPATAITAAADTSGYGALTGTYTYYCTYFTYDGLIFPDIYPYPNVESAPGPGATVTAVAGAVSIVGLPQPIYGTPVAGQPDGIVNEIRLYRSGGSLAHAYLVHKFDAAYPLPLPGSPWIDTQSDAAITAVGVIMPTTSMSGANNPPTAAPAVTAGYDLTDATAMIGTYYYYATFVNSAGLETNPGPASQPVTPTDGTVLLTAIPISPDPDTVKRRLYRTGGQLGAAYQVTEIEDNTTTTYQDTQTDLALTELGIIMPTTNDPPPTGLATDNMGLTGVYFNTLLAWKNGKLYWSQEGVPLFPGSQDDVAEGNWVNVGDPDEKVQTVTLHSRSAVIYKERTVWRLDGDAFTGTLGQTGATCGASAKTAVANCGSFDLVLSEDGLYSFDLSSTMTLQSAPIAPIFLGQQWVQFGASDIAQDQFYPLLGRCIVAYLNGTAFIGNCGGGGAGGITSQFLLNSGAHGASTPQATWGSDPLRIAGFASNLQLPVTAVLAYGSQYQWYAGDEAGNLLESSARAQSGQLLVWQTGFLDQGLGDTPKSYQEVVLDLELNGATATVYCFFDNSGNSESNRASVPWPYRQTFTGTNRQKFRLALAPDEDDTDGTTGDSSWPHISVRLEIACAATGLAPAVHGLYIYYSLEERDAAIRGTEVLDFHSERICLCKKMEIDAVEQVNLTVYSDLPGGTLTQRFQFAGSNSGQRAIQEFTLPPNLRGRLWRVDVVPNSTTARVYGVRGWMREIGLAGEGDWAWRDFILGSQAETPDAE